MFRNSGLTHGGVEMSKYRAPLDDMRFILHEVLNVSKLSNLDGFDPDMLDDDTINQFLNESAKISEEVFAPLNRTGDEEGCKYDPATGDVTTPKGFKEAYQTYVETGMPALTCDTEYGGMGMPMTVYAAVGEMMCSANMAFGMYPGLSHGAYNALHEYGSDDLKSEYLDKLVSGEWTGTMCLTESGAGTDLGLMKTKAKEESDGSYKVTGEKIFISAGEHDMAGNICHLVLAKIDDPDTPEGIRGVSLFLVPKFLPDVDGQPGERNSARCGGIEEKMGIHGNATCTMNFDDAKGFLIGEPNKGMKAMFVMMNEARIGVGLQGLGLAEGAYQGAVNYAQERVQGKSLTGVKDVNSTSEADPIIVHPDIRRELMTMKSIIEGERALMYWVSMQLDIANHSQDQAQSKAAKKTVDLLTPIIKAHLTDNAVSLTNSAIQVYGGHGYIKENGVEQYNRDARITQLYEGANGIQALDLMFRKVTQEKLLPDYLGIVAADIAAVKGNSNLKGFSKDLEEAVEKLNKVTKHPKMKAMKALGIKGMINAKSPANKEKSKEAFVVEAQAMATDYLRMMSIVSVGHMWLRMAEVSQERLDAGADNKEFYETKLKTAQFYFDKVMPQIYTLEKTISAGSKTLTEIASEHFVHAQGTVAEKGISRPDRAPKKQKKSMLDKFIK